MAQCGLYTQWPVCALSWCGFLVMTLVLKVGKLVEAQTRDLWDKVFWDKSFSHLLIKFIKSCENDLTQNTLLFTLTWLHQNQLGPPSQLTLSTYSYHQPMRSEVIKYTKPAVSIDCDINPPPPHRWCGNSNTRTGWSPYVLRTSQIFVGHYEFTVW